MKKEASSKEDADEVREYSKKNMEMIWLGGRMKTINKQLKKLREATEYIKEKDMDEGVRRERLERYRLQKEKIMQSFSKQYNAMKERRKKRVAK